MWQREAENLSFHASEGAYFPQKAQVLYLIESSQSRSKHNVMPPESLARGINNNPEQLGTSSTSAHSHFTPSHPKKSWVSISLSLQGRMKAEVQTTAAQAPNTHNALLRPYTATDRDGKPPACHPEHLPLPLKLNPSTLLPVQCAQKTSQEKKLWKILLSDSCAPPQWFCSVG